MDDKDNKFLGAWRIVKSEMWDSKALDLVVPAHMTFLAKGQGKFEMIAVQGQMDCRFKEDRVQFHWNGNDEGDPATGRGWAKLGSDGRLKGRIYFKDGDDSGFIAQRA